MGAVSFECTTAADSGEREIEIRALVAGASDADQVGLVTRANFSVTCPRKGGPDGGSEYSDWDGGSGNSGDWDGGSRNSGSPETAPPTMIPPDAAAKLPGPAVLPPPPDAGADAPAATSSSGSCTMATSGSVPWWTALLALAALLRLRRARR
jgi:hypothetical protein